MNGGGEVDSGRALHAVRNADTFWMDMSCCECFVRSLDNLMVQDPGSLASHGHGKADGRVHPGSVQRADGRNGNGSGGSVGTAGRPGNGGNFPNARTCSCSSCGDRNNVEAVYYTLRQERFELRLYGRYPPLALGWPALLLAFNWRVFVFFWAAPMTLILWGSGFVTMVCHRRGTRLRDTGDRSRNNLPVDLPPTWGDAWHNNHRAELGRAVFHHRFVRGRLAVPIVLCVSNNTGQNNSDRSQPQHSCLSEKNFD